MILIFSIDTCTEIMSLFKLQLKQEAIQFAPKSTSDDKVEYLRKTSSIYREYENITDFYAGASIFLN